MGNEIIRYQKVCTLKNHTDSVSCIAFSPLNSILASGSMDKSIVLWDITKLENLVIIDDRNEKKETSLNVIISLNGHSEGVRSISFSPDGKRLLSGGNDNTIYMWNVDSRSKNFGSIDLKLCEHTESVSCTTFSPDGNVFVTGSEDRSCIIWSITGKIIYKINSHIQAISDVKFSHNGSILATCSWDETVRFYQLFKEGYKEVSCINTGVPITSIDFGANSKTIACGGEIKNVYIYSLDNVYNPESDFSENKLLSTLKAHSKTITSIKYSHNFQKFASASEDKTAIIWKVDNVLEEDSQKSEKLILKNHHNGVTSIDFNVSGRLLATGSHDTHVVIYLEKEPKPSESNTNSKSK